jgi:hypothetical protein
LYLNGNQLTSIPREVEFLSALRWFDLSANRLTSLPPEMGRLSSIQDLDLSDNQLTSLPLEVGLLSSLLWLHLGDNRLESIPSCFVTDEAKKKFPFIRNISLVNNCLIALPSPPSSFVSSRVTIGAQRLLATHDACCSLDTTAMDGSPSVVSSGSIEEAGDEVILYFYATSLDEEGGGSERKTVPSPIHIADKNRLAERWPFFRCLLDADADLNNNGAVQSEHVNLSPYFSLRLGRCLVDYFDRKPLQVPSLSTQDCHDFVAHADYFGLSDTLLHTFCIAKLRKERES